MSTLSDLLYSKDHEWIRVENGVATVGITDYAQNALGDIVFVELPRVGQKFGQFAAIGVVESVKSVSDLFTPVAGEIIEVNESLNQDASLVNREPFGGGWMVKIKLDGADATANLMNAVDYDKLTSDS